MAWRFLTGRRGGRGRLVLLFSILLICAGVATLNTILAVMNGLQQGFISSILEIGSYHIRWTPDGDEVEFEAAIDALTKDPGVALAIPFREGQTMLSGRRSLLAGALIRGLPPDVYENDKSLADRLEIFDGEFNLHGRGIVLGRELALSLGVLPGDSISTLNLTSAGLTSQEIKLDVTGLFQCGYQVYESSLAFVSLETVEMFLGDNPAEIGVKLHRPEADRGVLNRLQGNIRLAGGTLSSWRKSNSAFFGALRNEKIMMILLLTLIFVVVAVNIDHSLRRMATERIEDLSILKAIGASPGEIRILFLRHGLLIGCMGGISGSVLGVLIGENTDVHTPSRAQYPLPFLPIPRRHAEFSNLERVL